MGMNGYDEAFVWWMPMGLRRRKKLAFLWNWWTAAGFVDEFDGMKEAVGRFAAENDFLEIIIQINVLKLFFNFIY